MTNDKNKSSLTLPINNLRIKRDIDHHMSDINQDFYKLNVHQVNYFAGELILYENHKKLGLIIQTSIDTVTVLTEQNMFQHVAILEISRKVVPNRNMICVDQENNVL